MKPISAMLDRQQNRITNRDAVRRIQSNDIPKCSLKKVEIKLPEYTR